MAIFVVLSSFASLIGSIPLAASQHSATGSPLTLNAEVQEQMADGRIAASGYVTLEFGDTRLHADRVEISTASLQIVAEGNVVFEMEDLKIVASALEADLSTGTGVFHDAVGSAGQDLYFHADTVEKVSKDDYIVRGGAFTSCAQPVPRWQFVAGEARIRRDRHVRLHNTFLKVKWIPVFYTPFMQYPIDDQARSTGFLAPRFGSSSEKGLYFGEAFFWAINRSTDTTFFLDTYSVGGIGGGSEFRYASSESSRGNFSTYLFRDTVVDEEHYNLSYSWNQDLPSEFRTIGSADYFSSFEFLQQYGETLEEATRRSKRASATVSRSWSHYDFRVLVDRNETAFDGEEALRQVLPSVRLGSRETRLGSTSLLFGFQTEAARFSRTFEGEPGDYMRFDVAPTVSYAFTELPFLTAKTSLAGRYTHYSSQVEDGELLEGDSVDRSYYELRVDTRGPTLARIFDTPGNFYAERFKHVIEPQVVWTYRSRVEDFESIPLFDAQDQIPGTNQLDFSLVNRFFAKRDAEGRGPASPVEFLTWTLSQRYFFDIDASLYDSQFSTPYFSPDGTPSHYSPLTSRLRFRPTNGISADWSVDYDSNFGKLRSMSVAGTYSFPRWGSASVSWTRTAQLESDTNRNYLRGAWKTGLSDSVWSNFSLAYDIAEPDLNELRWGVNYDVQCCGFFVEYARYHFGELRNENTVRFGITLANIGTFGGFFGGRDR